MGNIFGKDENHLSMRGLRRTDQYSENIPYLNKIQQDSRDLAEQLNISTQNKNIYNLFNNNQNENNSETSPFISSEMYNDILNNASATSEANTELREQIGGLFMQSNPENNYDTILRPEMFEKLLYQDPNATSELNTEIKNYMMNAATELTSVFNNKTDIPQYGGPQYGGNVDEFISDLEVTSSSETKIIENEIPDTTPTETRKLRKKLEGELKDIEKKEEEEEEEEEDEKKKKKEEKDTNMDTTDTNESKESERVSEMSVGSYKSSSAHSNEIDSNNITISDTTSVNDKYLSESINTSDINMISVE
jgi:hypothetical protein